MIRPRALILARDTGPVRLSIVARSRSALPPAGAAAAMGPVSMSTSEKTTTADLPAAGPGAGCGSETGPPSRALRKLPVSRTPRTTASLLSEVRCCGSSARTVQPVSVVCRRTVAAIPGTGLIFSEPALRTRTWFRPALRMPLPTIAGPLRVNRVAGPAGARGASAGSAASRSAAISQPQAARRRLRFEPPGTGA